VRTGVFAFGGPLSGPPRRILVQVFSQWEGSHLGRFRAPIEGGRSRDDLDSCGQRSTKRARLRGGPSSRHSLPIVTRERQHRRASSPLLNGTPCRMDEPARSIFSP